VQLHCSDTAVNVPTKPSGYCSYGAVMIIPTSSAGSCCWIIFTAGIENRGRKFCSESHNNFMVVVLLCVKIQQNDRQLMSTWRRHASLGLGVLLLLSEGVVLAWSRLLLQINSC
jgi:hypothetical protein